MLAVSNKIGATTVLKVANDRVAIPAIVAAAAPAMALDAANDDGTGLAVGHTSVDASTDDASWIMDWTRAWTAAASTMFDALAQTSGASLDAIQSAAAGTATASGPATSEMSLWTQPPRPAQPRSWYRPPQPNLLDPTAWGFPAPLSVYGVPVSPMGMGFNPMQPAMLQSPFMPAWSPLTAIMQAMQPGFGSTTMASGFGLPFSQPAQFANPFMRPPEHPLTAWMAGFAPQPVNPWASLTKTMAGAMTGAMSPTPYSNYRSDSGHAVAQIIEPAAKPSSVEDAAMAFWNLFTWPTPARSN
jgi:hypothetical protein